MYVEFVLRFDLSKYNSFMAKGFIQFSSFQITCLAMTTNERMNLSRYSHFHTGNRGKFSSPFDRGAWQNLVDFAQFRCFGYLRPIKDDWLNRFDLDQEDADRNDDREPLLKIV